MRFLIEGYRRLLTHPRYGVWVVLATLLYVISPFDLSPDILPIFGQIDDVALIVLLVSAASQWFTQQFIAQDSSEAMEDEKMDGNTVHQTIDIKATEVESSEG
ncbi:MAG: DUF1232 domain-containing protein [Leptolyngbya sp. SIO1D8]|nr:DUF1232 domain-containing protein [Leptolyngbya sp. SIO1D8]